MSIKIVHAYKKVFRMGTWKGQYASEWGGGT